MSRFVIALALVATLGSRIARADDAEAPIYACKTLPPQTKITVQFKPEVPLRDLIAWAVGFTCKSFVVASDVDKYANKVTIVAPSALTPKQALQLFVDAVEATGLTVVQKPDTIIIKLGPTMPKNCPVSTPPSASSPIAKDPIAGRETPPELEISDAELDGAIKLVDPTHREIKAAMLERLLQDPSAFAKGARLVPAVRNGQPSGFKLYAIRPSSVYAKLGFENGDTVLAINGFDVNSADKALEAYTKLRAAKTLSIQIERRGKPLTLVITVK